MQRKRFSKYRHQCGVADAVSRMTSAASITGEYGRKRKLESIYLTPQKACIRCSNERREVRALEVTKAERSKCGPRGESSSKNKTATAFAIAVEFD